MLNTISKEIKAIINNYSVEDQVIFRNKVINVDHYKFETVKAEQEQKTVTYLDGGQTEIISVGNFCLSFIRVFGVKFLGKLKQDFVKHEFYLLTYAQSKNNEIYYKSKVFQVKDENNTNKIPNLINEENLLISSNDTSIKIGQERAPISSVANMARRFAELKLAKHLADKDYSDYFLLDGTLEPSYPREELILAELPSKVCALTKTSSLFTTQGNNPLVLFSKICPDGCWSYHLQDNTHFVKLNQNSKHVFRYEGRKELLQQLLTNAEDALFLGYPYGLIFADRMARVSNQEKDQFKMKFLLNRENKELLSYLSASNGHEILDTIS
ncbi:MAG: hypothetical protein ABIG93_00065 [archaeon]|nr:hypothetical protein [Nanoarchaeota archaeon]